MEFTDIVEKKLNLTGCIVVQQQFVELANNTYAFHYLGLKNNHALQ